MLQRITMFGVVRIQLEKICKIEGTNDAFTTITIIDHHANTYEIKCFHDAKRNPLANFPEPDTLNAEDLPAMCKPQAD